MPSGSGERYDFFLSRRGSVASIAREVGHFLTERGYRVLVHDYDIPLGASFVKAMHEAIINSRDLIILFTEDYLRSPYTAENHWTGATAVSLAELACRPGACAFLLLCRSQIC